MGKAEKKLDFEKRKIIDNYDDYYSIINNNDLEQVSNENNQENDDFYINETANIIQHKIFEYVRRGMHPLCEYLDIDNMENYVRWLLNE
jgi:hypothetical protein